MTSLRRAVAATCLPLTTGWGIRLAVLTAVFGGVSVFLNGFAVKTHAGSTGPGCSM